jgi:predicted TIM-barrel fold metal-dependent hydrolase
VRRQALDLPAEVLRRVYHDNAARLYDLAVPEAA